MLKWAGAGAGTGAGAGAVPDDGLIVHLHDAVGVTAAVAARQTGEWRGWQLMLQVASRAGPLRQLPALCQGPSVTPKKTVKAEALGAGLGPKPVSSASVWDGRGWGRQEPAPGLSAPPCATSGKTEAPGQCRPVH